MSTLCIYHGGCTDGVAAAWAVHRQHPEYGFLPGVHQVIPADEVFENYDHLVLVDFSYKSPVLTSWVEREVLKTITVLDHHKSAIDDLSRWSDGMDDAFTAEFDLSRCGAKIAWDYYHPGQPYPPLMDYIDARDRWQLDAPLDLDLNHVTFGLRSYSHDHPIPWAIWDELMYDPGRLAAEGLPVSRYYTLLCHQLVRMASMHVLVGPDRVWTQIPAVNAPWAFASDVAGRLCEDTGAQFAMCWWQNADGTYTTSLRSRGDTDVSQIAVAFGGGGHAGAAGFSVRRPVWHSAAGATL